MNVWTLSLFNCFALLSPQSSCNQKLIHCAPRARNGGNTAKLEFVLLVCNKPGEIHATHFEIHLTEVKNQIALNAACTEFCMYWGLSLWIAVPFWKVAKEYSGISPHYCLVTMTRCLAWDLFPDHLLNKSNVCLCLKSSSLFSETQTMLSFRFGHSNCFQSVPSYVPWLVKMRVCHITAVVPDDLFHVPTQKSFPIALQLSISRPVNIAELHQLLTPSLSARINAACQIAAQHWTISLVSIHSQQCTNCKTPQSLGLSHFHGILN